MAARLLPGSEWTLRRAPLAARGKSRRGRAVAAPVVGEDFLQSDAVKVEEVIELEPKRGRRRATAAELALEVDVKPDEACVLAVRHASGALTFHASVERAARSRRRGGGSSRVDRFRIPIRQVGVTTPGRRGLVSRVIKAVVLKVAKAAVDKAMAVAMPALARLVENRVWAHRDLAEGWFRVEADAEPPQQLRLTPGKPAAGARALVLIHGTFSNAASAFKDLAAGDFFERVRPLYGDRIFAYNHFSVSRTPVDNAQLMLRGLGAGDYSFDAISHSRGGLVLRALVEQKAQLGSTKANVSIGHAVLVASPNDGTPLATPARWQDTFGWLANLLEVFPDNPFTTAAEFISEAVVWLAAHLAGDLPGLHSMDGAGGLVASLQLPPGPPDGVYSALVSNHHPDAALFARALDVGVDTFFAAANDLVVPSEGGWRIDRDGAAYVPGSRIGCFGPGGNLTASDPVHHLNFFSRPESAAFIAEALAGHSHTIPPLNPNAALPNRRMTRSARDTSAAGRTAATGVATAPAAPPFFPPLPANLDDDIDTFHIVVMDEFDAATGQRPRLQRNNSKRPQPAFAQVYATYGGARVNMAMRLHQTKGQPNTKTAFPNIIGTHIRIQDYTNRERGSLPDDSELKEFGSQLFETLFQGDVRRLYDEARSRQRGRRLDLVLTSMISWIGEKPWEFAYDQSRASFLATEEIHFVRNVLTSVPADPVAPVNGMLRILVASAQPVGFGLLSIDEETDVIRRGFDPLIENNLVTVDVLARATPATIHGYLSTGRYNVVHFIGHGEFSEESGGCLVFEDGKGGSYPLGERSLREIFCQRGLSLVFLNACQSGSGGRADFNKGVAQALVSHGLPALVANQYSVLDSSATSFAQHFYWSLAQGMSLGRSAREARIAVNYALQGDPIDWAVPVLYARDANRSLCGVPANPMRVPSTSMPRAGRRATRGRPHRIAVWDVDDVFPCLDRTLERLNAAQQVFGFEEVQMSVPLDVWDLESAPGRPYLHAEHLAERVKSKPVDMGVDVLVCITRHWMRSDEWLNLYGWWPEQQSPKVVAFSSAGFDQMAPQGPETDKVIANSMVTTLAGFYSSLDSHERGAKDCPLAFNQSRSWKYVAGPLKFDSDCRKKLRGLKDKLPALDALLAI